MEQKEIPFTIYTQATPNPDTMKFVANKSLVPPGLVLDFTEPEQCSDSPLAAALFHFPFVRGVFIAREFVSITKSDDISWDDIHIELRTFIQDYLRKEGKIYQRSTNKHGSEILPRKVEETHAEATTEAEKKIISILDEYIRPAVAQDGGAIHFTGFDESSGVLSVALRGACSGCPSSTITLKNGIQALFLRMMPEVKEVVAVNL